MSELTPLAKKWFAQMAQTHSPGGWTIKPEEAEKVIGPALADGVTYDEYVALTQVLDRSEAIERAILRGLNRWWPELTNALRQQFNTDRILKDAETPFALPGPIADLQLAVIASPSDEESNTIELSNAAWKFRLVVEYGLPRDDRSFVQPMILDRGSSSSVRVLAFHNGTLIAIDPASARELGRQCEALLDQLGTATHRAAEAQRVLVLKIARILQGPPPFERIAWRLHHPNPHIRDVGRRDISALTSAPYSPRIIPGLRALITDSQVDNDSKFRILYSWAHLVQNGDAQEYQLATPATVETLRHAIQHGTPDMQNVALIVLNRLSSDIDTRATYAALLDHHDLSVVEDAARTVRALNMIDALPKLRILAAAQPDNLNIWSALQCLESHFRRAEPETAQPRRD